MTPAPSTLLRVALVDGYVPICLVLVPALPSEFLKKGSGRARRVRLVAVAQLTVEAYRTRWGIHDADAAIGQARSSGPQRDEWQQARRVIDHAAPAPHAVRSSDRDRDHDLEVDLG